MISIIILSTAMAVARAEEQTQITVGVKVWNATWEQTSPDFAAFKSDPALLVGPTIGLRRGNLFAGLTFMAGTFDFPSEDLLGTTISLEADRKDFDLVVGNYVHPNWGVFAGYKKSDLALKASALGLTVEIDAEYSGPVIGVVFNAPLAMEPWIVFGNISYLFLELESSGTTQDAPGFSGEIAAAYPLENFPVSLTVGYKAQRFKGDTFEDDVQGLTFGANYTFAR